MSDEETLVVVAQFDLRDWDKWMPRELIEAPGTWYTIEEKQR